MKTKGDQQFIQNRRVREPSMLHFGKNLCYVDFYLNNMKGIFWACVSLQSRVSVKHQWCIGYLHFPWLVLTRFNVDHILLVEWKLLSGRLVISYRLVMSTSLHRSCEVTFRNFTQNIIPKELLIFSTTSNELIGYFKIFL